MMMVFAALSAMALAQAAPPPRTVAAQPAAGGCTPAAGPCPTPPAPPAITGKADAGGLHANAARRSNLRQGQALDAFLVNGSGEVISDVAIDLSMVGVTMRRRDGGYNSVSNLTVRRVAITASKAPIAIRGGSHDIVIEDARLHCTGTTDGIPGGVKIGARDAPPDYNITIRRAVITGCASSGRKGYPQGDGIATERPDHDITITDVESTDHGDGCLDLKSSATRLDNVYLARCNWGARLWAQGRAGNVRIGAVRKAGIQIKPTTDWAIERLYLPPGPPPPQGDIWADGPGGRLAIRWCSRPLTIAGAPAIVTLGPTCRRN